MVKTGRFEPDLFDGVLYEEEEVIGMEETKKETGGSIWVWVAVIGVALLLIVGFVTLLKP
jgi:hypothetical protein